MMTKLQERLMLSACVNAADGGTKWRDRMERWLQEPHKERVRWLRDVGKHGLKRYIGFSFLRAR